MTADEMKKLFRRHVYMWGTGDLSPVNEIIDSHYIGHVAAGDRDREGLETRIKVFRATFSDIVITIEDQLVDGDKVATQMTARGTHRLTDKATILMGLN